MKVIYFYEHDKEKDHISSRLPEVLFEFLPGSAQDHPSYSDKEARGLCVFINSKITAGFLDNFPNLRFIAVRGTGIDNIDQEETKKRGIVIRNVSGYGKNTVAEHAFALLLSLSHGIPDGYQQVLMSGFDHAGLEPGFDLAGKTLGVIGVGSIGLRSAQIGKGFNMNVIAFDPKEDIESAKKIGFSYTSLESLLAQSDIITLHVPLTKETRHLINKDSFTKMKKGVYVINTARGGIIDTLALVGALETGQVAGAGLDVLEREEIMKQADTSEHAISDETKKIINANMYLINHPRVIITPHSAAQTKEALERIFEVTVETIQKENK